MRAHLAFWPPDLPQRPSPCHQTCGSPLGDSQPVPAAGALPPAPTQSTLIHVLAAGWPRVPRGAGADGLAVDRVGVAVGALVAGIADARIVEVAQQT